MSQLYEGTARITYFDLDYRGRVKLSSLMSMVHIAAEINAAQLGVGHSVLSPLNMSFILQRFGLTVTRMPEYDETVTVRTWPSEVGRGTFGRLGDMYDGTGKKLMEWASLWILFDLRQRKIQRASALPVTLPEFGGRGVQTLPLKIDLPADWGSPFSSYPHTVRCSEVDTNMHMNSSVYGDLIDNALFPAGGNWLGGGAPDWTRVQINYLAEARHGEEINVECRREGGKFLVSGGRTEPPAEARGRTAFTALVETAEI